MLSLAAGSHKAGEDFGANSCLDPLSLKDFEQVSGHLYGGP